MQTMWRTCGDRVELRLNAANLAAGKYATDATGYDQMLAAARKFADRVRAIGGCNGIGRNLAHRLVQDGDAEGFGLELRRSPGAEFS